MSNRWSFVSECIFGILFLTTLVSFGQTSTNPPWVKWKNVETEHFRVIFPQEFERESLKITQFLESMHAPVSHSLRKKPKRISIILQNRNFIPNGFVSLFPRRSEFFTTPPQDYRFLGSNDWLKLLAIHEYRHVVQYEQMRGNFLYIIMGELGWSLITSVLLPQWFLEGDAVGTETALSLSGRGRIPEFQLLHRANLLDKKTFPYSKQYLRSYKDMIPNHYLTGYLYTSYMRRKYGENIWGNVIQHLQKPIHLRSFSRAMKKETGKNIIQHYEAMTEELTTLYKKQIDGIALTPTQTITKRKKNSIYTDYEYPQLLTNGDIIALKSGLGDILTLVKIKPTSGKEEILYQLGIYNSTGYLSSQKNKVVWNEFRYHPRWNIESYGVIMLFDMETKKAKQLTKKSKYAGAALSPDATQVVTTETDIAGKHTLLILDAQTGKMLKTFLNKQNYFYSMPQFSNDGKYITSLKQKDGEKYIVSIDIQTEAEEIYHSGKEEVFGNPIMSDNYLFYSSSYSGIDNIYAIERKHKKKYQVTSARLGAYNPHISSNETIFYNDFSKDGHNIVSAKINPDAWIPLEKVEQKDFKYYEPLVTQEQKYYIPHDTPKVNLTAKKYQKWKHFFNPVSWGFAGVSSPFLLATRLELGMVSKDVLSRSQLSISYIYDYGEKTHSVLNSFFWYAWHPIIGLSLKYGERRPTEKILADSSITHYWRETIPQISITLPYNITHNSYNTSIVFSGIGGIVNTTYFSQNYLTYVGYSLRFQRLLKQSKRDINSKFGQYISVSQRHSVDNKVWILGLQGGIFLPSLWKHHSVLLTAGFQQQKIRDDGYVFPTSIGFTRGISYTRYQQLSLASINYALPLAHPDFEIHRIVYFQRIKANIFFDYGYGERFFNFPSQKFYSTGIELTSNLNVFNYLPLLLDVGIQAGYSSEGFFYNILLNF